LPSDGCCSRFASSVFIFRFRRLLGGVCGLNSGRHFVSVGGLYHAINMCARSGQPKDPPEIHSTSNHPHVCNISSETESINSVFCIFNVYPTSKYMHACIFRGVRLFVSPLANCTNMYMHDLDLGLPPSQLKHPYLASATL